MKKIMYRKTPIKIGEHPKNIAFETHPYDLDIKRVLNDARHEINIRIVYPDVNRKEYIEKFENIVKQYCFRLKISFELNPALVIKSQDSFYKIALSLALIHYDHLKIIPFLDQQALTYEGKGDFVNVIEHVIYDIIRQTSPFLDKETTLKNILYWVNTKKGIVQSAYLDIMSEINDHKQVSISSNEKKLDNGLIVKKIFSLPALAYAYRYLSLTDQPQTINKNNCNEIAYKENHRSRTSGHKLLQYYSEYPIRRARIDFIEGNKRSERYRNKVFKEVYFYLTEKKITGKALEEFKADYIAFREKKFISDMDFINFNL